MKKFLLSLLCGFGLSTAAMAEVYTYTMADATFESGEGTLTWTCGDFSFTAVKDKSSNNAPTFNANGKDVRVYAKGDLTVTSTSGAEITALSFVISTQGLKRLTDITPSVGEIKEQGQNPLIWLGASSDVTFTVGEKATYGTDGASKAGQFDFSAVTVYTNGDVPEEGDPQEPETITIDSFNGIYDIEEGVEFILDLEATVIYSNGAYTYVNSGWENALIYKKDLGLKAGDVIGKGWKATYKEYKGLSEIIPVSELEVIATDAAVPEPMEVFPEDVPYFVAPYNQAAYLKLMNVAFEEAIPESGSFIGKMDLEEITFYQRFSLPTMAPGIYNVVGFVACYDGAAQFYPTQFDFLTGIENVAIDAEAPVKFYNIQGIQIANPQPGNVYIRVQGTKAQKVIK